MYQQMMGRGTMVANLREFAVRWRGNIDSWSDTQRGHSESSFAQTFWADLMRQFGVVPERMHLFEQDARRASTGRSGSIDVFWSGVFLGEAKSIGKDLDAAHAQALDYLAGGSIKQHEWPKYIIVTDFDRLRVDRLGEDAWSVAFTIDQIADYVDQLTFLAGHETVTKTEQDYASIEAARIMAELYEAMTGTEADTPVADDGPRSPEGEDSRVEQASVFLTRILFLLYGDNAGLWREDLFYDFVLNYTRDDGTDLGQQLQALFGTLNTAISRRSPRLPNMLARFPYVNGELFEHTHPTEYFDAEMREALLDACRFRWTRISPAVFGSMFQLVKSKEARRAAGEHYTSETNILKTIGPLFLDDLRAEADRLIRNKSTTVKALRAFRDSLATHVFVDPACGCGNFLVVAYRELRSIETDVIVAIRDREGETGLALDATLETMVTIGQFHGIEINWWPAKIAETAMFLVDHQANRALAAAVGQAPDRLPIEITAHIHHENALQADWSKLIPPAPGETYVFGNPPFIGARIMSADQKRELTDAWGGRSVGDLDYVTGWHAKALQLYSGSRQGAFGYVTTNSICQGEPVADLFAPIRDAGWRIKFAHRTFAWDSEAPGKAAVHCVIVGFTRDRSTPALLWDYPETSGDPVPQRVRTGINAYLVDGPWVLVKGTRKPVGDVSPVNFGSMPNDGGGLVVESDDHAEVAADPSAAKYLRRYVGSRELLHGDDRWCLWLENATPADVSSSPVLRSRLAQVRAHRAASKREATQQLAATPHLFAERRQPKTDYLCIPSVVSENRAFFTAARMPSDVITSNLAFTASDPDGLLFSLVSSSMFITWQRAVGGRLESRLRFSGTLSWNTFPVPTLEAAARKKIITAGQKVLAAREDHPERCLADHYSSLTMEPALVRAHGALDREVDTAFGAPRRLASERQRLEILFRLYQSATSR